MEQYLTFLQSLSDMGAAMRRVMAEAFVDEAAYRKSTSGENLDCVVVYERGVLFKQAVFISYISTLSLSFGQG